MPYCVTQMALSRTCKVRGHRWLLSQCPPAAATVYGGHYKKWEHLPKLRNAGTFQYRVVPGCAGLLLGDKIITLDTLPQLYLSWQDPGLHVGLFGRPFI